jgi:hypothetical protein
MEVERSAQQRFAKASKTLEDERRRVAQLREQKTKIVREYAINPSPDVREAFAAVRDEEQLHVDLLRAVDREVKRLMSAKDRERRAQQKQALQEQQRKEERRETERAAEAEAREEKQRAEEQRKEQIRQDVLEDFRQKHGRDPLPGERRDVLGEVKRRIEAEG